MSARNNYCFCDLVKMSMSFELYTLKAEDISVKLRPSQMTVDTIGKVFNLESTGIFLVGENGTVATPEEDGSFDTYEMRYAVNWTVSGNPIHPTHRGDPGPGSSSQQTTPGGGKWKPACGSAMSKRKLSLKHRETIPKKALPGSGPGGALSWTKTVEVCCYDPSIKKTFNLPVILNEQTATVPRLADMTSAEAFDGDPVALLDSDNLRVPDSIGTRGMYSITS